MLGYDITNDPKFSVKQGDLAEGVKVSFDFDGRHCPTFIFHDTSAMEPVQFRPVTPFPEEKDVQKFWMNNVVSAELWAGSRTIYLRLKKSGIAWLFSKLVHTHFLIRK